MIKRFHFCSKDFLKDLQTKGWIEAGEPHKSGHLAYAYDYLFKTKQINGGNGMFFLWEHPDKKGVIHWCDEAEASFVLLELSLPKDIVIDTDYDSWCNFILDLDEADGDLQLAEEICQESGIKDGLEGSYQLIFEIEDDSNIQSLVPCLKQNWITAIHYTKNKFV